MIHTLTNNWTCGIWFSSMVLIFISLVLDERSAWDDLITMQLRYLKKLDVKSGGDYLIDRYKSNPFIQSTKYVYIYISDLILFLLLYYSCVVCSRFSIYYFLLFSSSFKYLGISCILQICNNKKYSKNRTIKTRFKKNI